MYFLKNRTTGKKPDSGIRDMKIDKKSSQDGVELHGKGIFMIIANARNVEEFLADE